MYGVGAIATKAILRSRSLEVKSHSSHRSLCTPPTEIGKRLLDYYECHHHVNSYYFLLCVVFLSVGCSFVSVKMKRKNYRLEHHTSTSHDRTTTKKQKHKKNGVSVSKPLKLPPLVTHDKVSFARSDLWNILIVLFYQLISISLAGIYSFSYLFSVYLTLSCSHRFNLNFKKLPP